MSDPPIKIAVNGAAGRMGRQITALTLQDEGLQLAAALEFGNHPDVGSDAGLVCGHGPCGVTIESVLEHRVDVVIDFSTPEGVESIVGTCEDRRIPLVLATTGCQRINAPLSTQLLSRYRS